MSSISRRRNGLMALSVIGAPVLGEVLAPQSQDRTLTSRYSPNSPLATNYRGSGLVHRRILVIAGRSGEGPLTEPTAAARPWQRKLVFTPHTGHCPELVGRFGRKENGHSLRRWPLF